MLGGVSVETERHHPTICTTGRYGCWSYCSCGWISPTLRRAAGASLAWANHMAEVNA